MMEGNVPSAHMHKFTDLLKEGAVYAVQNYMVKPARKSYRAVDNRYRITITQYTKVHPVHPEPANIPTIPYKLQPLSVLESRYADKNIVLSDVAGILIELIGVIYPTGGEPRRNMKIQDMDENQFTITLWGHKAENFDEDAVRTISAQGSVTILFVSMATDKFRDKLSLKFTNLARYYIDANVPISSALKTML